MIVRLIQPDKAQFHTNKLEIIKSSHQQPHLTITSFIPVPCISVTFTSNGTDKIRMTNGEKHCMEPAAPLTEQTLCAPSVLESFKIKSLIIFDQTLIESPLYSVITPSSVIMLRPPLHSAGHEIPICIVDD